METPKAIAGQAAQTPDAGAPPWLCDDAPALPIRAVLLREPRRAEALHWGVVVLTAITAACVLFGARGGEASHPRELLPVMITVS